MTQVRGVNTYQAQVTFAIARHAVVDLTLVLRAKSPVAEMSTDRLTSEEFAALRSALERADVRLGEKADAEEALRKLRGTYEPFLHGLGAQLLLSVPPVMTDDGTPDNWQRSAWMKPMPGIGQLPVATPSEEHFG